MQKEPNLSKTDTSDQPSIPSRRPTKFPSFKNLLSLNRFINFRSRKKLNSQETYVPLPPTQCFRVETCGNPQCPKQTSESTPGNPNPAKQALKPKQICLCSHKKLNPKTTRFQQLAELVRQQAESPKELLKRMQENSESAACGADAAENDSSDFSDEDASGDKIPQISMFRSHLRPITSESSRLEIFDMEYVEHYEIPNSKSYGKDPRPVLTPLKRDTPQNLVYMKLLSDEEKEEEEEEEEEEEIVEEEELDKIKKIQKKESMSYIIPIEIASGDVGEPVKRIKYRCVSTFHGKARTCGPGTCRVRLREGKDDQFYPHPESPSRNSTDNGETPQGHDSPRHSSYDNQKQWEAKNNSEFQYNLEEDLHAPQSSYENQTFSQANINGIKDYRNQNLSERQKYPQGGSDYKRSYESREVWRAKHYRKADLSRSQIDPNNGSPPRQSSYESLEEPQVRDILEVTPDQTYMSQMILDNRDEEASNRYYPRPSPSQQLSYVSLSSFKDASPSQQQRQTLPQSISYLSQIPKEDNSYVDNKSRQRQGSPPQSQNSFGKKGYVSHQSQQRGGSAQSSGYENPNVLDGKGYINYQFQKQSSSPSPLNYVKSSPFEEKQYATHHLQQESLGFQTKLKDKRHAGNQFQQWQPSPQSLGFQTSLEDKRHAGNQFQQRQPSPQSFGFQTSLEDKRHAGNQFQQWQPSPQSLGFQTSLEDERPTGNQFQQWQPFPQTLGFQTLLEDKRHVGYQFQQWQPFPKSLGFPTSLEDKRHAGNQFQQWMPSQLLDYANQVQLDKKRYDFQQTQCFPLKAQVYTENQQLQTSPQSVGYEKSYPKRQFQQTHNFPQSFGRKIPLEAKGYVRNQFQQRQAVPPELSGHSSLEVNSDMKNRFQQQQSSQPFDHSYQRQLEGKRQTQQKRVSPHHVNYENRNMWEGKPDDGHAQRVSPRQKVEVRRAMGDESFCELQNWNYENMDEAHSATDVTLKLQEVNFPGNYGIAPKLKPIIKGTKQETPKEIKITKRDLELSDKRLINSKREQQNAVSSPTTPVTSPDGPKLVPLKLLIDQKRCVINENIVFERQNNSSNQGAIQKMIFRITGKSLIRKHKQPQKPGNTQVKFHKTTHLFPGQFPTKAQSCGLPQNLNYRNVNESMQPARPTRIRENFLPKPNYVDPRKLPTKADIDNYLGRFYPHKSQEHREVFVNTAKVAGHFYQPKMDPQTSHYKEPMLVDIKDVESYLKQFFPKKSSDGNQGSLKGSGDVKQVLEEPKVADKPLFIDLKDVGNYIKQVFAKQSVDQKQETSLDKDVAKNFLVKPKSDEVEVHQKKQDYFQKSSCGDPEILIRIEDVEDYLDQYFQQKESQKSQQDLRERQRIDELYHNQERPQKLIPEKQKMSTKAPDDKDTFYLKQDVHQKFIHEERRLPRDKDYVVYDYHKRKNQDISDMSMHKKRRVSIDPDDSLNRFDQNFSEPSIDNTNQIISNDEIPEKLVHQKSSKERYKMMISMEDIDAYIRHVIPHKEVFEKLQMLLELNNRGNRNMNVSSNTDFSQLSLRDQKEIEENDSSEVLKDENNVYNRQHSARPRSRTQRRPKEEDNVEVSKRQHFSRPSSPKKRSISKENHERPRSPRQLSSKYQSMSKEEYNIEAQKKSRSPRIISTKQRSLSRDNNNVVVRKRSHSPRPSSPEQRSMFREEDNVKAHEDPQFSRPPSGPKQQGMSREKNNVKAYRSPRSPRSSSPKQQRIFREKDNVETYGTPRSPQSSSPNKRRRSREENNVEAPGNPRFSRPLSSPKQQRKYREEDNVETYGSSRSPRSLSPKRQNMSREKNNVETYGSPRSAQSSSPNKRSRSREKNDIKAHGNPRSFRPLSSQKQRSMSRDQDNVETHGSPSSRRPSSSPKPRSMSREKDNVETYRSPSANQLLSPNQRRRFKETNNVEPHGRPRFTQPLSSPKEQSKFRKKDNVETYGSPLSCRSSSPKLLSMSREKDYVKTYGSPRSRRPSSSPNQRSRSRDNNNVETYQSPRSPRLSSHKQRSMSRGQDNVETHGSLKRQSTSREEDNVETYESLRSPRSSSFTQRNVSRANVGTYESSRSLRSSSPNQRSRLREEDNVEAHGRPRSSRPLSRPKQQTRSRKKYNVETYGSPRFSRSSSFKQRSMSREKDNVKTYGSPRSRRPSSSPKRQSTSREEDNVETYKRIHSSRQSSSTQRNVSRDNVGTYNSSRSSRSSSPKQQSMSKKEENVDMCKGQRSLRPARHEKRDDEVYKKQASSRQLQSNSGKRNFLREEDDIETYKRRHSPSSISAKKLSMLVEEDSVENNKSFSYSETLSPLKTSTLKEEGQYPSRSLSHKAQKMLTRKDSIESYGRSERQSRQIEDKVGEIYESSNSRRTSSPDNRSLFTEINSCNPERQSVIIEGNEIETYSEQQSSRSKHRSESTEKEDIEAYKSSRLNHNKQNVVSARLSPKKRRVLRKEDDVEVHNRQQSVRLLSDKESMFQEESDVEVPKRRYSPRFTPEKQSMLKEQADVQVSKNHENDVTATATKKQSSRKKAFRSRKSSFGDKKNVKRQGRIVLRITTVGLRR